MPIIILGTTVVEVRPRYTEITEADRPAFTAVLRSIWLDEFSKRLEKAAAQYDGETALFEAALFAEAKRLETTDLLSSLNLDPNAAAIAAEAIQIATERIIAELARHQLPAPPGLHSHAEALARNNEAIQAEARRRVEAKLIASTTLVREHRTEKELSNGSN